MRRRRSRRFTPHLSADDMLDELFAETITRFGVRMTYTPEKKAWRLKDVGGNESYASKRECLLAYFKNYGRRYGGKKQLYTLRRSTYGVGWRLSNTADQEVARWLVRPNRQELAATIKELRKSDSRPSYARSDTLGWRTFDWHPTKHCLCSPAQKTLWTEPELRVNDWSESAAVRGQAGIHACRLPKGDWRTAQRPHDMPNNPILALVERFGKFVLGSEGWRAEWVLIKEILAPDEATARALRRVYPEIPISVAGKDHWLRRGL